MADNVLKVSNLKVAYGGIKAVKGIDLEVNKGELITLIGANGAGKTTTLKAITGTLPSCKVEGEIFYLGESIREKKIVRIGDKSLINGAGRSWRIYSHDDSRESDNGRVHQKRY